MPSSSSSSSLATELKALVKQLQAGANNNPPTLIDILTTLKTKFAVTEAVLRESKAGLAVGKLRTHSDKGVSELAKELVAKWKAEVAKGKEKDSGGPVRKNSVASSATPGTPTTPNASSINSPTAGKAAGTTTTATGRTAKKDGVVMNQTSDATRNRVTELVYDALAIDTTASADEIKSLAVRIESETYRQHNHSTNAEYKARMRSLFANLKDKNNPQLRARLLSGSLSVVQLAGMSTKEMASEERKDEDKKIAAANLFATLGAGEQQAETDAFQCGRCKQRKCRYRQAQTRSADEPMTTFVTCVNCGNKWKFS